MERKLRFHVNNLEFNVEGDIPIGYDGGMCLFNETSLGERIGGTMGDAVLKRISNKTHGDITVFWSLIPPIDPFNPNVVVGAFRGTPNAMEEKPL